MEKPFDIITLKQFSFEFDVVKYSAITYDLKVISILNKNNELTVCSTAAKESKTLNLNNVCFFAWQEDISFDECYKLLILGEDEEITCCDIKLEVISSTEIIPCLLNSLKWDLQKIFQYCQNLSRGLEIKVPTKILKFDAKEAIIVFDRKYVVTLSLSVSNDLQVISFTDVSEGMPFARDIQLMKEVLFVLNSEGTVLSFYSLLNNFKVWSIDFREVSSKYGEVGSIQNFAVRIEMDLIVFYTENLQFFCMSIDLSDVHDYEQIRHRDVFHSQATTVTAFTKQYPSAKRIEDRSKRFSLSTFDNSVQPVLLNCDVADRKLKYLALFDKKLCFLFCGSTCAVVGVKKLDTDSNTVFESFQKPLYPVRGSSETFPVLFLSEGSLYLLLYDVEPNKLVNELMIYQCSGIAEELSKINSWQNIQLDVEVLKQGLRNRQLDAVEFFLKTHEEAFCLGFQSSTAEEYRSCLGESQLSLWDHIMSLLLDTIQKNLLDVSSCHFAERLLQVVISLVVHILGAVRDSGNETDCEPLSSEKARVLIQFSKYLVKLRRFLQGNTDVHLEKPDSENLHEKNVAYSDEVMKQWEKWDKRGSCLDVIRDAILSGNIAVAQGYFYNHEDISQRKYSSYKEFQHVGLHFANVYLKDGCIKEAISILLNLGVSVDEKLYEIFKITPDHDTRKTLSLELKKRNVITEEDEKSLSFLSLLENIYPCTSFEHAKQLLIEKNSLSEALPVCALSKREEEELVVGDLVQTSPNNCETSAYCCTVINWILSWDDEIRERILAPHFLKGCYNFTFKISAASVWNYLLTYGEHSLVTKWTYSWLGLLPNHSPDEFPYRWSLDESMINSIGAVAPPHIAELALNDLARYGIFCTEEQEDISSFLRRIGHSQCQLNDSSVFLSSLSTLSFSDLCHRLVHYSLKHNLVHFLSKFLEDCCKSFIAWPVCHICDIPYFQMMQSFCSWSQCHKDSKSAYKAMLSTAQYLYKLPHVTTKCLLTNVPTPLNIAILLFSSKPLSSLIIEEELSDADISLLKDSFSKYPLLFNCLFKSHEEKMLPDVNVYQLLQGNSFFDPTLLFGWQTTNTIRSEDALSELPHFSLSSLSEQYGLKEVLTYFYYLLEGRPSFAYLKFVACELSSENSISISKIRSTYKQVFSFAVSNFQNEKICSACVVFVEMLGYDSLPLRTCLVNAKILLESKLEKYSDEHLNGKVEQEIVNLFHQAQENKDKAVLLISLLEQAVMSKFDSLEHTSVFEDIAIWMPVMTLSHFLEVDACKSYLVDCAKKDNWIKFVVFSQIFQIPKDQVLKTLTNFSNSFIGDHLHKAFYSVPVLLHDTEQQTPKKKYSTRKDIRKSLYSRIGVAREHLAATENTPVPESDEESISLCSVETSTSSDSESGTFVIMKDLFGQLLHSHNTEVPWITLLQASYILRNPVLSLFAASYPESELLSCFSTWLATVLPSRCQVWAENFSEVQQVISSWTEEKLENLMILALRENKVLLLFHGAFLFLPSTPLLSLTEFLTSFIVYKKFSSSVESLKQFQKRLWEYPKSDDLQSPLHSLKWIEKVSIFLLKEGIICMSNYERQIMLRHLFFARIENTFTLQKDIVPAFNKLHQMVQCLSDFEDLIDVEKFFLPSSNSGYKSACWRAVKQFQKCHLYTEAKKFAKAAKLSQEDVFISQITQESDEIRESELWENLTTRLDFWKKISLTILENKINPHSAARFFKAQCDVSDRYGEKAFLLRLVIECSSQETEKSNASEIPALTTTMWHWFIKSEVKEKFSVEDLDKLLPSAPELVPSEIYKCDSEKVVSLQNSEEVKALEKIICHLLQKGDLFQAMQVAQKFNHECNDLKIVLLCFKLANGEIEPNNVKSENVLHGEEISIKKKKPVLSWLPSIKGLSSSAMEVIHVIENLCEKTTVASSICNKILVHFIVASVLNCSYTEIVKETNPFRLLKRILSLKSEEKFVLARSLITVYDLHDKNVAKFLSEEIQSTFEVIADSAVMLPENEYASMMKEKIIYNPASASDGFQLIVKLCQNPSYLGRKLLAIYSSKTIDQKTVSSSENLFQLVELCICAHDCFTAACDLEGISQVLHKSRTLVGALADASKFQLMIRLLTGIGRYSEMSYVFDILQEHQQFELLFRKGMEKVPHLRLALLDYIKRCPTIDADVYPMLALNFIMYREIAEMLERSVRQILSQLCKRNSDIGLRKELQDAMVDLENAADNYCKAVCLMQAQLCAQLAELVALQIYLLPSGTWIIGLDDMSVSRCITENSNFCQALIIAEAYKHHQSWSQAVYYNVINKGNWEYFKELQAHFGVSSSLIEDVAKRFQQPSSKSENQIKNMKKLLSFCPEIDMKYQLAMELSFNDVTLELLKGDSGAFVQDLIATNFSKTSIF